MIHFVAAVLSIVVARTIANRIYLWDMKRRFRR